MERTGRDSNPCLSCPFGQDARGRVEKAVRLEPITEIVVGLVPPFRNSLVQESCPKMCAEKEFHRSPRLNTAPLEHGKTFNRSTD